MTLLIITILSIAFIGFIISLVIILAALSLAEDEPLATVHWRSSRGAGSIGPMPLSEAILKREDLQDDPMLAGEEYWIEYIS